VTQPAVFLSPLEIPEGENSLPNKQGKNVDY